MPLTIEGELVAKSTGTVSEFSLDDRVFHQKFGYGEVIGIEGDKLDERVKSKLEQVVEKHKARLAAAS